MNKINCFNCTYFSKSPGIRNYFIFICHYWGLRSINKLPQLIVFESIGKKCPFFKEGTKKNNIKQINNSNSSEYV